MSIKPFYKQMLIVVFSSSLLACATTDDSADGEDQVAEKQRPDCILRSSIRGYTVLDESNLIVEASRRRHYHIALSRRARGLMSSQIISFETSTNRICAAFGEISYGGSLLNRGMDMGRTRIEFIRELDSDAHDDLLIRYGKKEPEIQQDPAPREVEGAEVEELDPAAQGD